MLRCYCMGSFERHLGKWLHGSTFDLILWECNMYSIESVKYPLLQVQPLLGHAFVLTHSSEWIQLLLALHQAEHHREIKFVGRNFTPQSIQGHINPFVWGDLLEVLSFSTSPHIIQFNPPQSLKPVSLIFKPIFPADFTIYSWNVWAGSACCLSPIQTSCCS